jgi:hypothetical protein
VTASAIEHRARRARRRRSRARRRRLGARSAARPPVEGRRPRGLRPGGRRAPRTARPIRPVNTVGESFTVYKVADIDVSLPRRESKIGRGHRGFEVTATRLSPEEAARRRDFTINAIAWDPLTDEYVDPFDGRGDLERGVLRASIRGRSATTACACCAPCSSPRASSSRSTRHREICRRMPLDDLPAERIWGEIEKLLLQAPRPSDRLRARAGPRRRRQTVPRDAALVGCPQEPEWHPEGDVWVHTLMVIDEARRASTTSIGRGRSPSCSARSATTWASRRPPRSWTGASARSTTSRRASRRPRPARPPQRPHDRRLRRPPPGARHRRAPPQAAGVLQGEDPARATARSAGSRRRSTSSCSRGSRCRTAGPHRRLRLLGDRVVPRARARPRRGARATRTAASRAGTCSTIGLTPGPAPRRILRKVYEQQLDGTVTTLEEGIEAAREIIG